MAYQTLSDWMRAKGLKDAGLAELAGISRSQVSRIRRGKSLPSVDTAERLAGVTKIPAHKYVMGQAAQPEDEALA